jgi:Uma2 family endonuclease
VNVSDRDKGWKENFRVPDVAVFLAGGSAINRKSHGVGGPDFAIEVISEGDRTRDKFDFYAKVGTRELLVFDRHPWALELYQLRRRKLRLAGRSTADGQEALASGVLPLSFRLGVGKTRPSVEVTERGTGRVWQV